MKAKTLQIVWHGKDPVLSVDFHPAGLLATAGADKDIKLWELSCDSSGAPAATYKSSLSHHNLPVNIVRFSPTGDLLASGGDGGELLIWKPVPTGDGLSVWKVVSIMRNHTDDVQDLCWSPDGASIVSGSVDNCCIVWDVAKATPRCFLQDHQHYVQGVAWDPHGTFIASFSADRSCRIHAPSPIASQGRRGRGGSSSSSGGGLYSCQHVLLKRDMPLGPASAAAVAAAAAAVTAASGGEGTSGPTSKGMPSTRFHLFHDENLTSFFRRLAWSPDGSLLVVPAGLYKKDTDSAAANTFYVFSYKDWSRPIAHFPGHRKAVVAVRFCPLLFTLLPPETIAKATPTAPQQRSQPVRAGEGPSQAAGGTVSATSVLQAGSSSSGTLSAVGVQLPHRMVFAVATLDSVYVYDTQRGRPLVVLAGVHYAAISDIAWSADGRFLCVCSQDGYCTIVVFDKGELGMPMRPQDVPPHIHDRLPETIRAKAAAAAAAVAAAKAAAAAAAATAAAAGAAVPEAATGKASPPETGISAPLRDSVLPGAACLAEPATADEHAGTGNAQCVEDSGNVQVADHVRAKSGEAQAPQRADSSKGEGARVGISGLSSQGTASLTTTEVKQPALDPPPAAQQAYPVCQTAPKTQPGTGGRTQAEGTQQLQDQRTTTKAPRRIVPIPAAASVPEKRDSLSSISCSLVAKTIGSSKPDGELLMGLTSQEKHGQAASMATPERPVAAEAVEVSSDAKDGDHPAPGSKDGEHPTAAESRAELDAAPAGVAQVSRAPPVDGGQPGGVASEGQPGGLVNEGQPSGVPCVGQLSRGGPGCDQEAGQVVEQSAKVLNPSKRLADEGQAEVKAGDGIQASAPVVEGDRPKRRRIVPVAVQATEEVPGWGRPAQGD